MSGIILTKKIERKQNLHRIQILYIIMLRHLTSELQQLIIRPKKHYLQQQGLQNLFDKVHQQLLSNLATSSLNLNFSQLLDLLCRVHQSCLNELKNRMDNSDAGSRQSSPPNRVQRMLDERVPLDSIGVGGNAEILSRILKDFQIMQQDARNLIQCANKQQNSKQNRKLIKASNSPKLSANMGDGKKTPLQRKYPNQWKSEGFQPRLPQGMTGQYCNNQSLQLVNAQTNQATGSYAKHKGQRKLREDKINSTSNLICSQANSNLSCISGIVQICIHKLSECISSNQTPAGNDRQLNSKEQAIIPGKQTQHNQQCSAPYPKPATNNNHLSANRNTQYQITNKPHTKGFVSSLHRHSPTKSNKQNQSDHINLATQTRRIVHNRTQLNSVNHSSVAQSIDSKRSTKHHQQSKQCRLPQLRDCSRDSLIKIMGFGGNSKQHSGEHSSNKCSNGYSLYGSMIRQIHKRCGSDCDHLIRFQNQTIYSPSSRKQMLMNKYNL